MTRRPPSWPPSWLGANSRDSIDSAMLDEGGVAGRLRARRTALGLTQAELAERAGISERAVSDIERGLRRVVYRETTRRLVTALELSDSEAVEFEAAARGRA